MFCILTFGKICIFVLISASLTKEQKTGGEDDLYDDAGLRGDGNDLSGPEILLQRGPCAQREAGREKQEVFWFGTGTNNKNEQNRIKNLLNTSEEIEIETLMKNSAYKTPEELEIDELSMEDKEEKTNTFFQNTIQQ